MDFAKNIAQIHFILSSTAFIIVYSQWITPQDDRCSTPSGQSGSCLPIKGCKFILDFLEKAPKPLTQDTIKTLRSYQCGFEGNDIKVCCPSTNVENSNGGSGDVPDVSRHRNIKLLPKKCGFVTTIDKIVFGERTSLFEFPWMALLSYRTSRGPTFKCGGTIINEKYILTAAHCLKDLKNPLIGVRVGEHNIDTPVDCEDQDGVRICSPPYKDLGIEEIIPHPSFTKTALTDDIGLIRVYPAMNLSFDNIKPVCLPMGNLRNYNFTNRNVIITGWGSTENQTTSNELLKAEIPIFPHQECTRKYSSQTKITEKQICAGGGQSDSCKGDSGGPMHVVSILYGDTRYIQVGIVSFGPRVCGIGGNPGVYTKVSHYMKWILDNMRN